MIVKSLVHLNHEYRPFINKKRLPLGNPYAGYCALQKVQVIAKGACSIPINLFHYDNA